MEEIRILIAIFIVMVAIQGLMFYQMMKLHDHLDILKSQFDTLVELTCRRWERSDDRYNKKYTNGIPQDGDIVLEDGSVKVVSKKN